MSKESTPQLSLTTLQIMINDWLALRKIMDQITLTRKEIQNQTPVSPLITETKIHNAFYGPYHEFMQIFSQAYASISQLRTHLTITQDENIKTHIATPMNLPSSIKKDINVAALDKLQRQLDDLAHAQFSTWETTVDQWQQQIIMQLTMNGVNLSELEIEDLSQHETLSEVLNRFEDLKLTLPKIKTPYYTFRDFLRCKAILAIHSALSRQHQPHSMDEIEKVLKSLKGEFKQIDAEYQGLVKAIEADVAALTHQLM